MKMRALKNPEKVAEHKKNQSKIKQNILKSMAGNAKKRTKRTAKQRAASIRNLEMARKKKKGRRKK